MTQPTKFAEEGKLAWGNLEMIQSKTNLSESFINTTAMWTAVAIPVSDNEFLISVTKYFRGMLC
jgi:hypothetical protein